jgi:predicted PurR-regulated permease PerM
MRQILQHFNKAAGKVSKQIADVKQHMKDIQDERDQREKMVGNNIENEEVNKIEINIAATTVIKVLVLSSIAIGLFTFFGSISHVIIIFLISVIFAEAMNPFADLCERIHVSRGIAVIIIYIFAVSALSIVLYLLVPLLAEQLGTLAERTSAMIRGIATGGALEKIPVIGDNLTTLVKDAVRSVDASSFQSYLSDIAGQLSNIAGAAGGFFSNIFNGVFNFIIFLVLTFFLVTSKADTTKFLGSLIPNKYRIYFILKMVHIQNRMGDWMRGQLALSLGVGLLTYVSLLILKASGHGIGFEETLAVIAGFTEFLPVIGPLLAAIPAVLIAINLGGALWLVVIGIYLLIQWIEGNVLVPVIMKKAVGLSPIIIIIGMMIAVSFPDKINPIVGIIISVPVLTIIAIFIEDLQVSEEIKGLKEQKKNKK